MQIGDTASISKRFTEQDVRDYAELVKDTNPIHLSEEEAKRSRFGKRIVHGLLTSGLISAVLATKLPGPGTIYLGQSLKFLDAVYLDEEVTAIVAVVSIRPDKPVVLLDTVCTVGDRVVIEGSATVLAPKVA